MKNIWGKIISLPDSVKIAQFVDIGDPDFGEGCKIQAFVSIPPGWHFGKRVFIGPGARFANDKHPNLNNKDWKPQGGEVGDDAVIGMGALIAPGIKIGRKSVIGMGAVVLNDVPDGETWVGSPARKM